MSSRVWRLAPSAVLRYRHAREKCRASVAGDEVRFDASDPECVRYATPLSIGVHFETWSGWAYDHAVARVLFRACGLPEVRCASIRELVDWLDARPPRLLRRDRAGLFPHVTAAGGGRASRATGRSG